MFAEDFANLDKILDGDYDIISFYYFEDENILRDEDFNRMFTPQSMITPTDLYLLKKTKRTIYKIDIQEKIWYQIIHSDTIESAPRTRELRDLLDYTWLEFE